VLDYNFDFVFTFRLIDSDCSLWSCVDKDFIFFRPFFSFFPDFCFSDLIWVYSSPATIFFMFHRYPSALF